MKANLIRLALPFLVVLTLQTCLLANTVSGKMDPIRFTISTEATYLKVNEEFEIKITAKYLSINPNLVYVFEGSNSFKLKLITPEGFKQTGGTYSDFVGQELTASKPSMTYTLKGKFTGDSRGGIFQLLRSNKNANDQSQFIQVGTLAFSIMEGSTDSASTNNARIAVVSQEYVPSMNISMFRAGGADTSKVIYINEGLRSGIFKLDPGNTTSSDDGSMVLVYGTKRYLREDVGYVRPEWFGADPSDNLDDYASLQAALNSATNNGITLDLSPGTYYSSNTLIPKKINSNTQYKLRIAGKGRGRTILQGQGAGLVGKNLIEIIGTTGVTADSYIEIKDMNISAGQADRVLKINKARNVQLNNLYLTGGEIYTVEIGDDTGDNYAAYVRDCYFNTGTFNGGQNTAVLKITSRYAEVNNMVSDGGYYAILCYADQMLITGCTLEGYKFAGIHAKSSGGGLTKIIGNTLRPYSGFDVNGRFNGTLHGIYLESVSGGVAVNTISGNQIYVPSASSLDKVYKISSNSGVVPSPHSEYRVTGNTSGATALVLGYNATDSTVNLGSITGTFQNETVTQTINGKTLTISRLVASHTFGISLLGTGGYNTITGNAITGGAEWGIYAVSDGNLIEGNQIHTTNGIWSIGNTQIIGNRMYNPSGISVQNTNAETYWNDNYYTGSISGIAPQALSSVTTTQRDAIVTPKNGLLLYDITVNKHTKYNGTTWSYFDNATDNRWTSGNAGVANLNLIDQSGFKSWDNTTTNTPGGYGTAFTFNGASADGDAQGGSWTNQILARTDGELFWRQRIYTYGTWSPAYKIWTSKNIVPTSANTAANAASSAPTKAEFDALLLELRTLKANMRSAGILE